MERRNILKKTKSTEPPKEEPKQSPPSLEENTFEEVEEVEEIKPEHTLPDPVKQEPVKVQIKPKSKKKPENYEQLANAREKSLENRRRKKEEQLRLKLEKEALEKELKELKSKYSQSPPHVQKPVQQPPKPRSVMDGIDYDILAERIYGKFQNVQTGIRADERKLAQQEYEEKLKQLQQPRQPAPRLTLYNSRKKPNRAFDMSARTGYHGLGN